MSDRTTRYGSVTRRAFLGGLSLAAIAAAGACSSSSSSQAGSSNQATSPDSTTPSPDTSGAASSGTSSSATSSASSSASATSAGGSIPAGARAVVSWTYAASGGMARNPYMAVWIEDASGAFVKTLALYHRANGDNWLNSLSSWYTASGGTDTTTSGTVPAGSYTATWDGSSAAGGQADQGSYFVCVESAVEHGAETLVRQQVEFAGTARTTALTPSGSITAAAVAYTP